MAKQLRLKLLMPSQDEIYRGRGPDRGMMVFTVQELIAGGWTYYFAYSAYGFPQPPMDFWRDVTDPNSFTPEDLENTQIVDDSLDLIAEFTGFTSLNTFPPRSDGMGSVGIHVKHHVAAPPAWSVHSMGNKWLARYPGYDTLTNAFLLDNSGMFTNNFPSPGYTYLEAKRR
jgi:hypothetical protein